ncbi:MULTISPECIES: sensor histidine kinase [Bacillaceae]|uniref:histidine kinase n=1 Tax=Cytobacillus oceanisediminis 2691 TaxID=1196031 RepID=A0A160MHF8_9BACI|nr:MULTISPECIES: ATP-binding protein [Bacillaceae]AND42917.1 two-component sensor histidine kinase [Cytobacillus oceanisediminis 2691]MBN8202718.1 HAMP domain-containing protein [Bacillus sp. NTK034]MCM3244712.1 cell wall metabolism sensor histidine kinase WalK [Cytobacillus oceanisediminis]USK47435.1 cell wall metabolism sensor histidine kinase WalK [Cytobacillus oceanisediminis]
MNKLSIKLGVIFFLIIFGLVILMFFFLHSALVDSRIEEELLSLQARGNSHRAILEKHFDADTISHVTLMESEANTDVVITDVNGKILGSSANSESFERYIYSSGFNIPRKGEILEDNWKNGSFISTVSPIEIDGRTEGRVYMFQDTESLHALIKRLNGNFLLAGIIAVCLTLIIIVFLSKGLAKPLIKMKEATFQISRGDFSVSLPKNGNDELGDLAHSISRLANDLKYLKQERNDFLASISHELRTPLTYIKGYADIVLSRNLSIEDRDRYLNIIHEEANRLSDLIKDLFDLAKMDKNSFIIQKKAIDLTDFMMKINQKFTPAFQEKEMELEVVCPEELFIMADPSRLEQIIFNLLDNAIKYSPSGAKTLLSVSRKKKDIYIQIQDNGKGIPEEDLPYILNRFYRVDKSRTRSLGGTGLGLAIVKELVLAHGGKISVKSEEGKGTEFELIFKGAGKIENDTIS